MAYSVNWLTKVITIPKADTEWVSTTPDVRKLSATTLWENLRSLEDDPEGMPYPQIVKNTTPVTLAGVTFARQVEIINGYTLTFEDGLYAVDIYGGNTNVADVTNRNQVSVRTANSAGLVVVDQTSSLVTALLSAEIETGLSLKNALRLNTAVTSGKISGAPGPTITIRNVGDTKDRVTATVDVDGNRTAITYDTGD